MSTDAASLLLAIKIEDILKGFFVLGLVMYCAFALIITRQASVMSETMEAEYNGVVKLVAWLHLGMAIMLVILAMSFL